MREKQNAAMWIDAIEIFSSFGAWIKVHEPAGVMPVLDQIITNFLSKKAKEGVTRTSYLRAQDMAAVVNFS